MKEAPRHILHDFEPVVGADGLDGGDRSRGIGGAAMLRGLRVSKRSGGSEKT